MHYLIRQVMRGLVQCDHSGGSQGGLSAADILGLGRLISSINTMLKLLTAKG